MVASLAVGVTASDEPQLDDNLNHFSSLSLFRSSLRQAERRINPMVVLVLECSKRYKINEDDVTFFNIGFKLWPKFGSNLLFWRSKARFASFQLACLEAHTTLNRACAIRALF